MKRVCRLIQQTLADRGADALRADEAAQRHLDDCDECFAVLESLVDLDAAFEAMPAIDAPDELVERLLDHDELQAPAAPTPAMAPLWRDHLDRAGRTLFGRGRLRSRAWLALVLVTVISLTVYVRLQQGLMAPEARRADLESEIAAMEVLPPRALERRGNMPVKTSETPATEGVEALQQLKTLGYVGGGGTAAPQRKIGVVTKSGTRELHGEIVTRFPIPDPTPDEPMAQVGAAGVGDDSSRVGGFLGAYRRMAEDAETAAPYGPPTWVGGEAGITFRGTSPRIESDLSGPFDEDADERQRVRDRLRERLKSLPRDRQDAAQEAEKKADGQKRAEVSDHELSLTLDDQSPAVVHKLEERLAPSPRELAREFLAERERHDGVSSQTAAGYWTNTYVPGDPALRFLQARLTGQDRSALERVAARPLLLHDAAQRATQPFDPPSDAAMSVHLRADRSGLEGESRILVQVGLVATDRHGGRRPAMNVGVVLDLRGEIAPETAAGLRALVLAFGEARDLGDRFRLIVAGRPGAEIVAPEDFRHGPLTVAARGLLLTPGRPAPAAAGLGLVDAVRTAIERVGGADDPELPLGSSAVVVISSQPLGAQAEALAELAHRGAVAGITVSAVGVGDGVDLGELEHLALAGQGSRRLLREASEATALVDRELAAVGRVVARAVRLRIGLQPGVRLIEVVGARRYDAEDVMRVRRAERSIDLRMARNLGIEADRGDDEPGIQIVIPTFTTGDRHVVLLDVVAPGPGPIADVTMRFKDLVQLENGVARARLDLPRGDGRRGPLERNVLKNLLAQRLHDVLESAAAEVATGDPGSASERLAEHRHLLAGLALELPVFETDRDLGRDVAMLDEYVQLLDSAAIGQQEQRLYLARSLGYAGRLKVLPAPMAIVSAR